MDPAVTLLVGEGVALIAATCALLGAPWLWAQRRALYPVGALWSGAAVSAALYLLHPWLWGGCVVALLVVGASDVTGRGR